MLQRRLDRNREDRRGRVWVVVVVGAGWVLFGVAVMLLSL